MNSSHTFQVGRIEVSLHTTRKACEHFAVSGALVDLLISCFKVEVLALVFFAKFCILAGTIGVLLLHKEEQSREEGEEQHERVQASQGA